MTDPAWTRERAQARRALWRGVALGLGMMALGLLAWWYLGRIEAASEARAAGPLTLGQPAPDFALQTPTGETIRLHDLRGRVVVLNVWATWCEPCKVEMPLLQRLAERYADRLVVLGVNYGEDAAAVQAFAAEYGLTFPLLLDPQRQVVRLYGVRGLPTTVFLDAEGRVHGVHLGALTENDVWAQLRPLGVEP